MSKCRSQVVLSQVVLSLFPLCAAILLFATNAPLWAADQDVVFGPKQFVRTTGKPNTFTETFQTGTSTGQYQLRLDNGTPDGKSRISSATIRLNGQIIFAPNAFNQQVHHLEQSVALQTNNTLQVELASKPKSFLTIQVVCVSECLTLRPELTAVEPATGPSGAYVVISGSGLRSGARVLFGNNPSPAVTLIAEDQLRVLVPLSSQNGDVGPLPPGPLALRVDGSAPLEFMATELPLNPHPRGIVLNQAIQAIKNNFILYRPSLEGALLEQIAQESDPIVKAVKQSFLALIPKLGDLLLSDEVTFQQELSQEAVELLERLLLPEYDLFFVESQPKHPFVRLVNFRDPFPPTFVAQSLAEGDIFLQKRQDTFGPIPKIIGKMNDVLALAGGACLLTPAAPVCEGVVAAGWIIIRGVYTAFLSLIEDQLNAIGRVENFFVTPSKPQLSLSIPTASITPRIEVFINQKRSGELAALATDTSISLKAVAEDLKKKGGALSFISKISSLADVLGVLGPNLKELLVGPLVGGTGSLQQISFSSLAITKCPHGPSLPSCLASGQKEAAAAVTISGDFVGIAERLEFKKEHNAGDFPVKYDMPPALLYFGEKGTTQNTIEMGRVVEVRVNVSPSPEGIEELKINPPGRTCVNPDALFCGVYERTDFVKLENTLKDGFEVTPNSDDAYKCEPPPNSSGVWPCEVSIFKYDDDDIVLSYTLEKKNPLTTTNATVSSSSSVSGCSSIDPNNPICRFDGPNPQLSCGCQYTALSTEDFLAGNYTEFVLAWVAFSEEKNVTQGSFPNEATFPLNLQAQGGVRAAQYYSQSGGSQNTDGTANLQMDRSQPGHVSIDARTSATKITNPFVPYGATNNSGVSVDYHETLRISAPNKTLLDEGILTLNYTLNFSCSSDWGSNGASAGGSYSVPSVVPFGEPLGGCNGASTFPPSGSIAFPFRYGADTQIVFSFSLGSWVPSDTLTANTNANMVFSYDENSFQIDNPEAKIIFLGDHP